MGNAAVAPTPGAPPAATPDAIDISGMPDPPSDLIGSANQTAVSPSAPTAPAPAAPAAAPADISGMPTPSDLFKQAKGRAPKSAAELQTFTSGAQDLKLGQADPIVGIGELALNAGTGLVGQVGGFLAHVGTLLATQDPDAAKAVRDAVSDALTYQPKYSTTGPAMQEATSAVMKAAWNAAKGPEAKSAVDKAMRAKFGDSAADSIESGLGMAGEAAMATASVAGAGGLVRGAAERAVGDIGVTPHVAPTAADIRGATQPDLKPARVATVAAARQATPPVKEAEARPVTAEDLKSQPDPLAAAPATNGRPPLAQGGTPAVDAADGAQARADMDAAAASPDAQRPPLQPGTDPAAAHTDAQVQADMSKPAAQPGYEGGATAPSYEGRKAADAARQEKFVPPQAEGVHGGEADAATQADRTSAIQDLHELTGGQLPEVRQSALTGDYDETGTDFQHAKMNDAGGKRMQAVIGSENTALKEGAKAITDGTGSVADGVDQTALTQRGTVIDKALGKIQKFFDNGSPKDGEKLGAVQQDYADAKERAQGQPVPHFSRTQALLGDQTEYVGTAEGEALHRGAVARAQKLGLIGQDGAWKPATVEQAERFRQWLGDQWTPRTAKMIAKTKDALDGDVAEHAGADIYNKARRTRTQMATMFEQPGIASLMQPTDRLGISREVPIADIADHIADLDPDQFNHVVNVLKSAAHLGDGELAESSAAALNEIKGHMAARLEHAGGKALSGGWSAKDFYKQADAYSQKIPSVFNDEERRRIQVVNRAGNVLRMDKSYPGAAATFHNTNIVGSLRASAAKGARGLVAVAAHAHLPVVGPAAEEALGIGAKVEKMIGGDPEKRRLAMVEKRIAQTPDRVEPSEGGSRAVGPGNKQRGGPEFNPYDNSPSRMRPLKPPGKDDPRNTAKPNADVWGAERTKQERGGLGAKLFGGRQRGAVGVLNNGSGESSASLEAQSRVSQEKAAGQNRYSIDPDGNVTPLRGVDSVDARAPQGSIIVQRGVGAQPYSVLDRGGLPASQAHGLLARSQGMGHLAAAERAGQKSLGGMFPGQRGGPKFNPKADPAAELKDWFSTSKVVDAKGEPQVVYHGTNRLDRFQGGVKANRATSGPMPFFTDDPAVAAGYAKGKQDTSLSGDEMDYRNWYKFKPPGGRSMVPLSQKWYHMTADQHAQFHDAMHDIRQNEDSGEIERGEKGGGISPDTYDYELKRAHGNGIEAAKELWLSSGALFNQEHKFGQVMRHAGVDMKGVDYQDHSGNPGTVPAYLRIHNPLDTADLSQKVGDKFEPSELGQKLIEAVSQSSWRKKSGAQTSGDIWDKGNWDQPTWLATLKDDLAKGSTHAWTSIPDKVTKILRSMGYDGIKDSGGKNHPDARHNVWIPFDPGQVRTAIGTPRPSTTSVNHEDVVKSAIAEHMQNVTKR